MYAIIRTGGKQYRVAKDDVISVEKLSGEAGATVEFGEVLMIGDGAAAAVGDPLVAGAKVMAKVLEQTRADKILVFKKKRRKKYRRTQGHRQDITVLRATELLPAWNLFRGESRTAYREALGFDDATWARGRGLALSVAVVGLPYYLNTNPVIVKNARDMIDEVLADHG